MPTTFDPGVSVISVSETGSSDIHGVGVGWARAFVATVTGPLTLSGSDGAANRTTIQDAINSRSGSGGGVVSLPSGTYPITGGGSAFDLKPGVVVKGAGKTSTILEYGQSYSAWAEMEWGGDGTLSGVMDLTLYGTGSGTQEGLLIKENNKIFFKNVKLSTPGAKWQVISDNTNIAFVDVELEQRGKTGTNGCMLLSGNTGVHMRGCSLIVFMGSGIDCQKTRHCYMAGNTFTRDSDQQNVPNQDDGVIHTLVFPHTFRAYIGGNTFATINGAVLPSDARNDGEQLLSEGGGGVRTENRGTVTSADATHFTDSGNTIDASPGDFEAFPENYLVAIVGGKGVGQVRRITAIAGGAGGQVTITPAWIVTPDTTSKYATFVVVDKVVIRDNDFTAGGSRGYWLYQCTAFDQEVVNNTFSNSGTIYLRQFQNNVAQFNPHWNINVRDNSVDASGGTHTAAISSVFVNNNTSAAFGVAALGLYFRDNALDANATDFAPGTMDLSDQWEGYGLWNKYEGATPDSPSIPGVLGNIFQSNDSTDADNWLHLTTGDDSTTLKEGTLTSSGAVSDVTGGGSGTASVNTITYSTAPPSQVSSVTPPDGGGAQIILQHASSAKGGDLIWLFGQDFGATPAVLVNGVSVPVVNAYGSTTGPALLVAQLPDPFVGIISAQVGSGGTYSDAVALNQARPWGIDTLELHPSGEFKIFGRNMKLPGFTPAVTVDGLAATVDSGASNEHMLACTAPAGITTNASAVITVDNSATLYTSGARSVGLFDALLVPETWF